MKLRIGIVDYGIGNWASIRNSLKKIGFQALVSTNHAELKKSDLILLPGVGAFKPAMNAIKERKIDKLIYEMVNDSVPLLGICLGMQLLGRSSIENEYTEGLNIISEDVYPLYKNSCHIGWNSIKNVNKDSFLNNFDKGDFYFNHSYAFPSNLTYTITETTFKNKNFSSIIKKDNIAGLQFHPEKSQSMGLEILHKLIMRIT